MVIVVKVVVEGVIDEDDPKDDDCDDARLESVLEDVEDGVVVVVADVPEIEKEADVVDDDRVEVESDKDVVGLNAYQFKTIRLTFEQTHMVVDVGVVVGVGSEVLGLLVDGSVDVVETVVGVIELPVCVPIIVGRLCGVRLERFTRPHGLKSSHSRE